MSAMARSGVQSWSLSPAGLSTESSSGAARLKRYHSLDPCHSVSLYLSLIGFNERFNNAALPIKSNCHCPPHLMLGHCFVMLVCPFLSAKTPTAFLLAPASHTVSLVPHLCLFLLPFPLSNREQGEKPCVS